MFDWLFGKKSLVDKAKKDLEEGDKLLKRVDEFLEEEERVKALEPKKKLTYEEIMERDFPELHAYNNDEAFLKHMKSVSDASNIQHDAGTAWSFNLFVPRVDGTMPFRETRSWRDRVFKVIGVPFEKRDWTDDRMVEKVEKYFDSLEERRLTAAEWWSLNHPLRHIYLKLTEDEKMAIQNKTISDHLKLRKEAHDVRKKIDEKYGKKTDK